MIILSLNDLQSLTTCLKTELKSHSLEITDSKLHDHFANISGYDCIDDLRKQLPVRLSHNTIVSELQDCLREQLNAPELSITLANWNPRFPPDFDPIVARSGTKLAIAVDTYEKEITRILEIHEMDLSSRGHLYHLLPDVITQNSLFKILAEIRSELHNADEDTHDLDFEIEEIIKVNDTLYGKSPLGEFLDPDFTEVKDSDSGISIFYCDEVVLHPLSTDKEMNSLAEFCIYDGLERYCHARQEELLEEIKEVHRLLSTDTIEEIKRELWSGIR